jgi:hypothetical protein
VSQSVDAKRVVNIVRLSVKNAAADDHASVVHQNAHPAKLGLQLLGLKGPEIRDDDDNDDDDDDDDDDHDDEDDDDDDDDGDDDLQSYRS